MRIASLLPAATELVCAIGAADLLVARSHECDFPPGVEGLPAVTATTIDSDADSRSIQEQVQEAVTAGLSIYEVDFKRLAELQPDLILTQDLCAVCAVDRDMLEDAVAGRLDQTLAIENLAPTRLADVWAQIRRLGELTGRTHHAADLLKRSFARLAQLADDLPDSPRPEVVSIEWLDPVMLGGLWMPDLIRLAGGKALGVGAGEPAPTLSRESLDALSPEVVVIKPCGFDLNQARREIGNIHGLLPDHWPAVEHGRVWLADGNAYFNRPGPRLVDAIEMLAAIIHPGTFDASPWLESHQLRRLSE